MSLLQTTSAQYSAYLPTDIDLPVANGMTDQDNQA